MLGNDQWGDCVFAGTAHQTMVWNRLGSKITVPFNDNVVLGDYSAVTGFDPNAGPSGNNSTDQGTDVHDGLNYIRNTGVQDSTGTRHKIAAYVALDPKNWDQLMLATYIFSAVGIGFEFPNSAMTQFNRNEIWDVVPGAVIEGGHYVPVVGTMARTKVATVVTWGRRQQLTRAFYELYNDEAYGILSPEQLRSSGTDLHNFDLVTLQADLAAL